MKNQIRIMIQIGITFFLTGVISFSLIPVDSATATEDVNHLKMDQGVDPLAAEILNEMNDFLLNQDKFSLAVQITYDEVLPTGTKLQYGADMKASVRRPDRLFVEFDGDITAKRYWYDGTSITLMDDLHKAYATVPVPSTINEALRFVREKYDLTMPLADLFYSKEQGRLVDQVKYGAYVGIAPINNVPCHHLVFVQPEVDWQIWVEDGARPVPRKILITYKLKPESPQYTAVISKWDFKTKVTDKMFIADLPESLDQIKFLTISSN